MQGQKDVLKQIEKCRRCPLYKHQKPLLDSKIDADVFWVGLSAVKVECTEIESPLSVNTNSGKLIAEIENRIENTGFYRTNLVKCLPLQDGKIRYPKKQEMKSCCHHLAVEISEFRPKLVFLLGKQVGVFITEDKNLKLPEGYSYKPFFKGDTVYVPVHHPSYILVYKRKQVESYINGITSVVHEFMSGTLLSERHDFALA